MSIDRDDKERLEWVYQEINAMRKRHAEEMQPLIDILVRDAQLSTNFTATIPRSLLQNWSAIDPTRLKDKP